VVANQHGHRRGHRGQHFQQGGKVPCKYASAISRIERRLDSDRKELLRAIGGSQKRLAERLVSLEKRTRDQVFGLNQAMKEAFAQERGEALDRADRRAIRERVAIERQQVMRDMALKRDLVRWLDSRLQDIEKRHRLDEKSAAALRTIAVKRFSKYTKSAGGLLLNPANGGLRRAHSEELISEVGVDANNNAGSKARKEAEDNPYEGVEVMPDFFAAKLRTTKRRDDDGSQRGSGSSGVGSDEPGYRALTVSDRPPPSQEEQRRRRNGRRRTRASGPGATSSRSGFVLSS